MPRTNPTVPADAIPSRVTAAAFLVPFACYLLGVALLGGWVMDDAGISFAYARNLAAGHGLVSQPGRVPVEGFSNFLWVLLAAPTFLLRIFHPILTPKILGALLFAGTLAILVSVLRRRTGVVWPAALAALALATSPPLVIWTSSGLENGLLLLLATVLWALSVLRPRGWAVLSGLAAGLLALTRPDGLLYAGFVPVLLVIELLRQPGSRPGALRRLAAHLGTSAAVIAALFLFRLSYFKLVWPHTYYAKREWLSSRERLADLLLHPAAVLERLADLCRGIAGPVGPWLLVGVLAAAALLLARRRLEAHVGAAVLLAALGIFGYLWLEPDWMGEYRFGTVAVAMSWVAVFGILHGLSGLASSTDRRVPWAIASAALLVVALAGFAPRLWRFAANPPTSYGDVSRTYARRFNAYAGALGLERGSILIADAGAMLMESRLTVYDAAGLFEPAVVGKLKKNTPVWQYDHPEFNDWVLDQIKPTFVVTRAFWTNVTALEQDPRFARNYAALDAFRDLYVLRTYGRNLHSGDFVRIDALPQGMDLERLRASYRPERRPQPVAYRLVDFVRRLRGAAPTAAAIKEEARRLLGVLPDPNRAAELLERCVAAEPRDTGALLLLATALDTAGRCDEARRAWEQLGSAAVATGAEGLLAAARERLDPPPGFRERGEPLRTAESWLALSLQRYRERRFVEAIEAARAALALRPGYAEAHNNICASFNELGEWVRAIESCTEALRINPAFELARNNLRWAAGQADVSRP